MEHSVWTELAPLSPGVSRRWDGLSPGSAGLGDIERLRRSRGAALARFVSLQAELRRRAARRLDVDRLPFLTSKGSEQATPAAVARYRAARFAEADIDPTAELVPWDACCGVGSDLVELAGRFGRVVATDRDVETLRCAVANVATNVDRGVALGRVVPAVADASRPPLADDVRTRVLGLFDPDRRPNGRREAQPDRWGPPFSDVLTAASELAGACVKLPPGMALDGSVPDGAARAWISLDGEMKELSLWTGRLADVSGAGSPGRVAVALRSSGAASTFAADPVPFGDAVDGAAAAGAGWLVELDVAVWQADLAGALGRQHELAPLAGGGPGGFLTARARPATPFARAWRILGTAAGDRKRVRALLREHDVGRLVVKTRNHPETADRLARSFAGTGAREGLLAVTRIDGRTAAFLLDPEPAPARG